MKKTLHLHCVVVYLIKKFDKRTNSEKWTISKKQYIKEIPDNQALFQELTDYTSSYKKLETEKKNIQYEVNRLKYKNDELQKENRKLKNCLHVILQSLILFFHRLLKIGEEQDKDNAVNEKPSYYDNVLYTSNDLHNVANDISREK